MSMVNHKSPAKQNAIVIKCLQMNPLFENLTGLSKLYTKVGIGHYSAILNDGTAFTTDGIGTKAHLAWALTEFETIGIDLVAMNVNDLLSVGAVPMAMLDYISIPDHAPEIMHKLSLGLVQGAKEADIDIPGGEIAFLPGQFDFVGAAIGRVPRTRFRKRLKPILGTAILQGDSLIGIPSSGIHANGMTEARQQLGDDHRLLTPTRIYVRPIKELLFDRHIDVRGLAHITGGGLTNLDRLGWKFQIDDPLPNVWPFTVLDQRGIRSQDFNYGMGFCVVVPATDEERALDKIRGFYPGAQRVGFAHEPIPGWFT